MLLQMALALFLPATTLALPGFHPPRATEPCAPTNYTLSDFTLITSPAISSVAFVFKSVFSDPSIIEDSVTAGSACRASGSPLPNNNECDAKDRNLLFDLRAPQEVGRYQITHTWRCNGKQWISGNDVTVGPLACQTVDDKRTCTGPVGGAQIITPQNVREIPTGP